jgi:altronate dehydratase
MTWQATALATADNVAVVLQAIAAGETVRVSGPQGIVEVLALEAIPLCHKIALADLASGAPVLKYGQCIGETRVAIKRGTWVHTHNLRSRRAQPSATR